MINSVKKALELSENEASIDTSCPGMPPPYDGEPETVGDHPQPVKMLEIIQSENLAIQSETARRILTFLDGHPKIFFTERELALALGCNTDESFRNALASLPSLIEKTEKGFRIKNGDEKNVRPKN